MKQDLTQCSLQGVFDFVYAQNQEPHNSLLILSEKEVKHIIGLAGGFWHHNGDPKAPHAVMRSGKHTDGFVSLPEALKYVAINNLFAATLAKKIHRSSYHNQRIDWVIGSDHAAGTFSYAVADELRKCNFLWRGIKQDFTEKAMVNGEEIQKWSRHVIKKEEFVLQVEELCSTNLTIGRVYEGVNNAHPDYTISYVPIVGMAVNRTGRDLFHGRKVVSLLNIKFKEWDVRKREECSLCKGGSEPLEDVKKSAATWAKLNCH
ncbi:MAG: Uncharacterized protein G01um101413_103 [Parcubacteria group bacterium Gr01-1014_13]|nr:MAG: Uncharacterized protein G01um101413_103 [Parcubacteria group bacterium Gr01-1014_13]